MWITLLCGVLAVGLPDHTQCLFHVVLTLPHALEVLAQFVHGLAPVIQWCVRTLVVHSHVLVVRDVVRSGAIAGAVSSIRGCAYEQCYQE